MADKHIGPRHGRLLEQGLQLLRLAAGVPGQRAGLAPSVSGSIVGDDLRHPGDALLQRSQLVQLVRNTGIDDDGGSSLSPLDGSEGGAIRC